MKPTPTFDAFSLESPENEEFAEKHSKVGGVKADEQIIKLLNPTEFIGECDTTKNWRIRHGAFDRDTSIAIPVILATMLKNKGYEVMEQPNYVLQFKEGSYVLKHESILRNNENE